MMPITLQNERHLKELRLLLEETCCNLCRFHHIEQDGLKPDEVRIEQEVCMGASDAFADIKVQPQGLPPYFIEVNYGYPPEKIVAHMARKYGTGMPGLQGASKVILVIDIHEHESWIEIQQQVESCLQGLKLEIWDEEHLVSLIHKRFELEIDSISGSNAFELQKALDNANGQYVFGDEWANNPLQSSLLWHFSPWKLKQLREKENLEPRDVMSPGMYKDVVTILVDLSSFSSYVRDTRSEEVVRHALTSFYSKTRYEILNTGGMLYQFVGDEVIGLYGIPERQAGYHEAALECAESLVHIGNSVSNQWQRHIDRVQESRGVHIGMAVGPIQFVSLRPFSRVHLGAVSDSINMAARLLSHAGPGEVVISNTYYQNLDHKYQAGFTELEPVDARNVGKIIAWKKRFQELKS
ncbi:adenylate/guanylate cyclase domain-containing protein [Desulfobacterales bacterium HSG2]|nr:adenylate/guanylate cyclase domain-containing protein [Desulfobacterales bacterium HSG2]